MPKELMIQKGYIQKIDSAIKTGVGLFSFDRWLKQLLNDIGVGYSDPCCAVNPSKVFTPTVITSSGPLSLTSYVNLITTSAASAAGGSAPATNTATIPAPVQSAATTSTTGGTLAAATYFYVITALTAAGETIKSNEVSITTTGTTSSNTINWAAVTGATGYRIYRGTATGAENVYYVVGAVVTYLDTNAASTAGTPPTVNTAGLPSPVQNALVTALTGGFFPAGTYYYVVTALNAQGESLKSNEQFITTTGTTSTITISWAAVTGATGYKVYRGTASTGENVYYAPGNVTSYIDTYSSVGTLAPGYDGQKEFIKLNVFGGSFILYPTVLQGGTTITFPTLNSYAELLYSGGRWNVLASSGIVIA